MKHLIASVLQWWAADLLVWDGRWRCAESPQAAAGPESPAASRDMMKPAATALHNHRSSSTSRTYSNTLMNYNTPLLAAVLMIMNYQDNLAFKAIIIIYLCISVWLSSMLHCVSNQISLNGGRSSSSCSMTRDK